MARMTKYQAHRHASNLWATRGIADHDRVAMVVLRRKSVVERCEVGYYVRGDGKFICLGKGPNWETAFGRATKVED